VQRSVPLERLNGLTSPTDGLNPQQVAARRAQYGANVVLETVSSGWWILVRDTLQDPMLWFLLGTSALFGFVGEYTEALILLAALIPFLGMDAFLHRRTQASVEGLGSRLATEANVIRDGVKQTLPTTELVPGDLVVVRVSEPFPADGVILQGWQMQADESALTGEAYPVPKQPFGQLAEVTADTPVDNQHWGLAGTRLLTGEAAMRVVYTGAETLYGEITRSAISSGNARTPLQRAVASLVKILVAAAAILCMVLAVVRFQQGYGVLDAVLSALTLAVAALPEEFPVVFTFFLGVGVYRLAKRQALVRRAVVVENIGRVSVICSDKTGTITEGRLQLEHLWPAANTDTALLGIAAAASRQETGDPLDIAILANAEADAIRTPVARFPFTEERKCEMGVFQENGVLYAAVKGAAETIFALCDLDAASLADWKGRMQALADGGHKIIACAWRQLPELWDGNEPTQGFRFAGLLEFADPVREGVQDAITQCRQAGIHVIMVTGDHPATARAIAAEIGLGDGNPHVLEGDRLEAYCAGDGGQFLRQVDVVARAIPSQKLALVRTLQAQANIVAVTGDGVNDVPALQAADIGIAMGGRGTRSAREAAAIVLLDDNFRSIVAAIAEGRQLFRNLQLSFVYLLAVHIPLVLTATVIPLAGYPLLYLPIHIVWLEMIIHPTALLVFQQLPPQQGLQAGRYSHSLRFFDARQWTFIVLTGLLLTLMISFGYIGSLGEAGNAEHARAMALVALSSASAGITAVLSRLRSAASRWAVVLTLLLAGVLVQTPVLAELLHLQPLHLDDWGLATGGGLLISLLLWLR
jgi:Ca2+-transporting ATPase